MDCRNARRRRVEASYEEIATVGIRHAKNACLNRMLSSNDNLIFDV
jgi:hypothetical protein